MTNPLPLIPLVVVHGTLGSGKTTVVRELLKTPVLRGAFIIENEFAHENIDGMALGDEVHDDQLAELSGGCVCCSSLAELEGVLADLAGRPWNGPVILETTGVASAADLLIKLYTSTTFVNHFSLVRSIFVLDAVAVSPELALERRREVLSSDIVALSKADIAAPSAVQKLKDVVQSVSPDVDIVQLDRGRAAWDELVSLDLLSRVEYRLADVTVLSSDASDHTRMTYAVVNPEQLFTDQSLRRAVTRLFSSSDMRVVRVKGFVAGKGDVWWHVEATIHQVDITPSQAREKKVLVCIGEGVTVEKVALMIEG